MTAPPQHAAALDFGRRVRLAAAAERARIAELPEREGRYALADLLESYGAGGEALWSRARVDDLVQAIHQFGPRRTNRLLAAAGIARHNHRVRELTLRQRVELARLLRDPRIARRANGLDLGDAPEAPTVPPPIPGQPTIGGPVE